jgi:hypothetical protein
VSCYARARFFPEFSVLFESLYRHASESLLDYNLLALDSLADALGIERNWVLASKLDAVGQKSELVLDICRRLGATVYYSGRQGSTYLKRDEFDRAGIGIRVQNFTHPIYEQVFMREAGFVPNLSVVDLLFNCGAQSGGALLRSLN